MPERISHHPAVERISGCSAQWRDSDGPEIRIGDRVQVRHLHEGMLCLLVLGSELAVGGVDQPWLDEETGGGLIFGGALAVLAAYTVIKNWPLQTLVIGSAILLTWLLSLILGDFAGLIAGSLLLAWVLNGCPVLLNRGRTPYRSSGPHKEQAEKHVIDTTPHIVSQKEIAILCRCGVTIPIRHGYEGNVRCHRCNKIHEVKAVR